MQAPSLFTFFMAETCGLPVLCVILMFTIIAVDFFVWQGENPQEYIRISRDLNEARRKKTL